MSEGTRTSIMGEPWINSKNFVSLQCVRRCGLRIAWLLPNDRTNFVALQPLWAARCLRRIRQPRLFVSLAVRAPLWAAHCRDCSPHVPRPSLLCSAHAAAGCALSSSHPTVLAFCFLCGAHAAVGCALSSSHPTTQAFRLHCRVASDCPRPSLPCNACFFFL